MARTPAAAHPPGAAPAARTHVLDALAGPIPAGAFVHVWGGSGSGKTSLLLAELGHGDILLDAEGMLPGRIACAGPAGRGALIGRPAGFDAMNAAVASAARLLAKRRARRVLVDGLLHYWRFERCAGVAELAQVLSVIHALRAAARAAGGVVVATNQATAGPTGEPRPIGGLGILHLSDIIVKLETLEPPWVRGLLEKHPVQAAGRAVDAKIVKGLLTTPHPLHNSSINFK